MARPRNVSRQSRLLLTTTLVGPRAWYYGYELSKQTGLTSGTLYPLLMRRGDLGYLDSKWQEPERAGRPPRHGYRLSARGAELAREAERSFPEQAVTRRRRGVTV